MATGRPPEPVLHGRSSPEWDVWNSLECQSRGEGSFASRITLKYGPCLVPRRTTSLSPVAPSLIASGDDSSFVHPDYPEITPTRKKMAPDLSSVPLSSPRLRPRAATAMQPTTSSPLSSRRPSQVMGPPLTSLPSSVYTGNANENGNGSERSASGPLRHPKPLTPSDLHSMLEQEQEAMVNRLSRELSLLRQQTSSVASTTSSTSTSFNDSVEYLAPPPTNPSTTRRHRSSSSLSSSYIPAVQGSRTASINGIAPSRDSGLPSNRSRAPSLTSPRQADSVSPTGQLDALSPHNGSGTSLPYPHRSSLSQQRSRSHTHTTSITRPDELAQHRAELDAVKRENEMLRRRVRDLELTVRRLQDDGSEGTISPPVEG